LGQQEIQNLETERTALSPPVQIYSAFAPPPPRKVFLPALLFVATVFTTLLAGISLHFSFLRGAGAAIPSPELVSLLEPRTWLTGVPFSATLLAILLAHEMGHFLACVYYGIDATYPYFLPAPPPPISPFGTFGAVIRIKSPFGDSRELFDVGIAGPIAGFVVLLPALIIGLSMSTIYQGKITEGVIEFGEPLLFKCLSILFFHGQAGEINLHPIGYAAWFGMLATSANLIPVGQLDGGHVVYAILGPRGHRWVSRISVVAVLGLALATLYLYSFFYLVFALVLLLLLGLRHPSPLKPEPYIDKGRILLTVIALIILILTFIPVPVRVLG
jgi:membrane-associated protease RseP (regulator of RpoE activity)